MKYITAFLILIGGLVALVGFMSLIFFIGDKIKEWVFNLDCKNKKYRDIKYRFNNDIMPWIGAIFVLCLLIVTFVCAYLDILKCI